MQNELKPNPNPNAFSNFGGMYNTTLVCILRHSDAIPVIPVTYFHAPQSWRLLGNETDLSISSREHSWHV